MAHQDSRVIIRQIAISNASDSMNGFEETIVGIDAMGDAYMYDSKPSPESTSDTAKEDRRRVYGWRKLSMERLPD